MRVALALLVASAAAGPPAPSPGGGAALDREYVFAVVPQAPPVVMTGLWDPVVERIAREAGVRLRIRLYDRVEAFQADLETGAVDFAFLNPVQAVRANRMSRYRPVVRNERPVRGVFFVARDSKYDSVRSLAGREVAFVSPWSFCSVTLRKETESLGIVPRYVGTPANAYKHVILGLTQAGGTLDDVLDEAPTGVVEKLRVIFRTPPMAAHAVVAHPRVPRAAVERVAAAFHAVAATESGARLLDHVHLERPVPADYARDYAPLERILDPGESPRPTSGP